MAISNQNMVYIFYTIFALYIDHNDVLGMNFDFSGNTPPPSNSTCIQISLCAIPNYCRNSGSCIFDSVTCETTCSCPQQYTGTRCEKKICSDMCNPSPCKNGGNCTMNENTCEPECRCPTGLFGTNCTEIDLCRINTCETFANLCVNNEVCIQDNQTCDPICHCPPGFSGTRCDSSVLKDSPSDPPPTTTLSPTTSLAPLPDRRCATGFVCIHGVCNKAQKELNRFQCDCDPGYLGTFCTKPCTLDCGKYGECYLNGTHEQCACHHNWIGERCATEKPDPPLESAEWVWWVVGSCSILIVLLILLLIVLPMWLWKRRELFIMKIVHYIQPYEDSDGKLFDAFISYKSHPDDEGFVLNDVYQKLEKELGFKLCLHFRDFKVGETIANNILWAVENSRRTVLIISPNYLGSEFARFEFQTAHLETLRLQSRIVPVIYKDISQHEGQIDATLKHILKTITYLEWPQSDDEKRETKFWKRLALSLPKRKEMDQKFIETKLSSSKDLERKSEKPENNKNSINLLSFKTLTGNSFGTSLDDQGSAYYHKNIINSRDISLNISDSEKCERKPENRIDCLPV